jgi:hypothetical protein
VSRVTFRQAVELLQPTASSRRSGATAGAVRQDRWLKVETTLSDLADMYCDTSLEIVNISASRSDAPVFPENGNGRLHASASFATRSVAPRPHDVCTGRSRKISWQPT